MKEPFSININNPNEPEDRRGNSLVDKLLASVPAKTGPSYLSQEEDEVIHGVRPPRLRGGRMSSLYRAEVDEIAADTRPRAQIAADWGISYDTVSRVKQVGRFKNVPYIPRDECDRTINYLTGKTYQATMLDTFNETKPEPQPIGRPFASGRGPLEAWEFEQIGTATNVTVEELMERFGVSRSKVREIRRTYNNPRRRGPPVERRR